MPNQKSKCFSGEGCKEDFNGNCYECGTNMLQPSLRASGEKEEKEFIECKECGSRNMKGIELIHLAICPKAQPHNNGFYTPKPEGEEEQSPYCNVCGGCGHIGCDGVELFLEGHVRGRTDCDNEDQFIDDIISTCKPEPTPPPESEGKEDDTEYITMWNPKPQQPEKIIAGINGTRDWSPKPEKNGKNCCLSELESLYNDYSDNPDKLVDKMADRINQLK